MREIEGSCRAVLHDAEHRCWLEFLEPEEVVFTHRMDEVMPLLRRLEERVESGGLHAAGFVAYEAAPACDAALTVHPPGEFPLLWFGLFRTCRSLPHLASPTDSIPPPFWSPSLSKPEYDRAVATIRNYIHEGDTYQVNFTFRLRTSMSGDPWLYFLHLVAAQPAMYPAYMEAGRWSICCASPELFFSRDGNVFLSKPMKGTAARGFFESEDLVRAAMLTRSVKERAENLMIVDMVRNDMGRLAEAGTVSVPSIFAAERYPTLWQMTSTVACRTDADLPSVFRALFPAASITGAPKVRTMEIIRELESSPRRIYTGTIGFLRPGQRAQFNVAIRTALIDRAEGRAEYGTGSGITWDSDAQGEYAECLLKADILTHREPAFDLLETMVWRPEQGYHLLQGHLRRLASSSRYFDRAFPEEDVRRRLDMFAAGLPRRPVTIRLTLSASGTIAIGASPLPESGLYRITLGRKPVDRRDVFLYHKTTHRQVYDAARRDAPDTDDVLLWNEEEEITESTRGNIVAEIDGERVTPPVRCGLLAGVYRSHLLENGTIRERVILRDDLPRCTRLFLINAVRGMWEIRLTTS